MRVRKWLRRNLSLNQCTVNPTHTHIKKKKTSEWSTFILACLIGVVAVKCCHPWFIVQKFAHKSRLLTYLQVKNKNQLARTNWVNHGQIQWDKCFFISGEIESDMVCTKCGADMFWKILCQTFLLFFLYCMLASMFSIEPLILFPSFWLNYTSKLLDLFFCFLVILPHTYRLWLNIVWSLSLMPHPDLSPHSQMPNGLPIVNSYVTAPSIHPYHPPTQVSPYMGYSGTTSACVTGPTWQPPSGSALSPRSCDITAPLAFKSMATTRDAMHPVTASALWFRAGGQHMWDRTSQKTQYWMD